MVQKCTKCLVSKRSAEFGKDKRNLSGLRSQCNACRNTVKAEKVVCSNCTKTFRKDTIARHKAVCKGDLVQKTKGLKSSGLERIQCTCGHARCIGMVNESTSYKHLRYGNSYWESLDSAAAKRKPKLDEVRALRKQQMEDRKGINKLLKTIKK
jgi:hypothetical protein